MSTNINVLILNRLSLTDDAMLDFALSSTTPLGIALTYGGIHPALNIF